MDVNDHVIADKHDARMSARKTILRQGDSDTMATLKRIALFITISFIAPFSSFTYAANLDAETIIIRMIAALEPEIASTRTVTFSIKDHEKVTNTWVAREARKKLPDGKRILMVMIKPDEVKGTARLVCEGKNQPNVQWVYLPALKRTTKIVPISLYDSFQGTDFTYSDLGFLDVRGCHKLLGNEEHAGVKAYKVETIPTETWYYSRMITWISQETFLPLQRDLYDVSGELWKTQLFKEVTTINNIPTPLRIEMVNVQARTGTEYKVSEVCYGAELPNEIFEPKGLTKALEYDFCPLPPLASE